MVSTLCQLSAVTANEYLVFGTDDKVATLSNSLALVRCR